MDIYVCLWFLNANIVMCSCTQSYGLLDDFQIDIYIYNWANELVNSLNLELEKLVQWQNARSHLTTCILTQKLGLFHHSKFENCPSELGSGVSLGK